MQITKYLYRIKFEWPDVIRGPIISFLCYAETPEEVERIAQEIGMNRAQDMDYIGVELLPYGLVLSSRSAPVPAMILVDSEAKKD